MEIEINHYEVLGFKTTGVEEGSSKLSLDEITQAYRRRNFLLQHKASALIIIILFLRCNSTPLPLPIPLPTGPITAAAAAPPIVVADLSGKSGAALADLVVNPVAPRPSPAT
ncbi:hypothetical protein AQUCO_03100032v1 [Aquilegia coerulea]|uniref:Uncharacterized protein n=1 Tax=Aquilegia coerulea TaxID=218851 RepID=A0A2G5D0F1_AQUCA|nr:hypothetical protein AQUCO_03100032v1 [Aquilegia coerulea]